MTFKRSKCIKCQAFGITPTGYESKDKKRIEVRCNSCKSRFYLVKPKPGTI